MHLITVLVQTKVSACFDLYDQQHLGLMSSSPAMDPSSERVSGLGKMVHTLAVESMPLYLMRASLGFLIQIL